MVSFLVKDCFNDIMKKFSDINIVYDGFVKGLILKAFNLNSVAGKKEKEEVVDDVRKQLATAINEKALAL